MKAIPKSLEQAADAYHNDLVKADLLEYVCAHSAEPLFTVVSGVTGEVLAVDQTPADIELEWWDGVYVILLQK